MMNEIERGLLRQCNEDLVKCRDALAKLAHAVRTNQEAILQLTQRVLVIERGPEIKKKVEKN